MAALRIQMFTFVVEKLSRIGEETATWNNKAYHRPANPVYVI